MKKIILSVFAIIALNITAFGWTDYTFGTTGTISSIVAGDTYVGFYSGGNILGIRNLADPWSPKAKAFYAALFAAKANGTTISINFGTYVNLNSVTGHSEESGKYFFDIIDFKVNE